MMKKYLILAAATALFGCAEMNSFLPSSGADSSTQSKLHSCMMTEANSRLQAGTLFTDTVMNTAKDIAGTCTKKLALQSLGISEQAQSDAANIINSLRNLNS